MSGFAHFWALDKISEFANIVILLANSCQPQFLARSTRAPIHKNPVSVIEKIDFPLSKLEETGFLRLLYRRSSFFLSKVQVIALCKSVRYVGKANNRSPLQLGVPQPDENDENCYINQPSITLNDEMLSCGIPTFATLGYSPIPSSQLLPPKLACSKNCHLPPIILIDEILSFQKPPT